MIDISDNSMYNLRILIKTDNCSSHKKGGNTMTNMNINKINPKHSAASMYSDIVYFVIPPGEVQIERACK